jgi:predicted nucleic acid-binding protein
MITLDTSALLAILNAGDRYHTQINAALHGDSGPYIIPAGMLSELAYMIETRYGLHVLDAFLSDCESGAYVVDCGEDDIPRIRALVRRYADLPLGFADASVIACAERHGGRVMTLDLRHFGVVAREGRLTVVPE